MDQIDMVLFKKTVPDGFHTYFSVEHHSILEKMPPFYFAVGVLSGGIPAGIALVYLPDQGAKQKAKLLDFRIEKTMRRLGIGRVFMNQLCLVLKNSGVRELTVEYLSSEGNQPVISAFFRACGFNPPHPGIYICSSSLQVPLEFPWVKRMSLPGSFTIKPFYSILPEERNLIKEGLEVWYPSILDPFAEEELIDKARSLILSHHGAVVGWLILEAFDSTTILCKTMFVRPPYQRMARGIALLAEAGRRMAQDPVYKELIYFVEAENQPMVTFLRKRVSSPHLKQETLWRTYKTL